MKTEQNPGNETTLGAIVEKIENVKKRGFGEVRIIIRNGAVYRILTTEDELIEKDR